jgi:hypothetical protein
VPSTMSEKNARNDKLPLAAFRLKNLTDAQLQAIYRSVVVNPSSDKPAGATAARRVEVGMVLPPDALLDPLPVDAVNSVPQVKDLQYHLVGNKLVLADPLYREVLAIIDFSKP